MDGAVIPGRPAHKPGSAIRGTSVQLLCTSSSSRAAAAWIDILQPKIAIALFRICTWSFAFGAVLCTSRSVLYTSAHMKQNNYWSIIVLTCALGVNLIHDYLYLPTYLPTERPTQAYCVVKCNVFLSAHCSCLAGPKALVMEYRGDWKWIRDLFQLKAYWHWKVKEMCHCCFATNSGPMKHLGLHFMSVLSKRSFQQLDNYFFTN